MNRNLGYYWFIIVIIIFFIHTYKLNCVAEDAFISFRFAKNLANGYGLTWNIGEAPVEGYTNFLWVILCALAIKSGIRVTTFAQIGGVLSSILIMFYTLRYAIKFLNCKVIHALIPCIFLAVSGPFATWASSGMEINFFCLSILMACYYFVGYWQFNKRKYLLICFVSLFIATLTRPEGLLIVIILLLLSLVLYLEQRKNFVRDFLFFLILYITPFSIYFTWRLKYYGFLLPNTFYAKVSNELLQYLRGTIYCVYFFVYFVFPLLFLLILLIWEKGFSVGIGKIDFKFLKLNIRKQTALYVFVFICLFYTLYIIFVGGDYMAMYRFFVPILPLIYIMFLAPVTNALLVSATGFFRKRIITTGILIFAVGATFIHSTPLEKNIFRKPPFQHGHFRGVQTERWHTTRLSMIGKFFNEYKNSTDESLATAAIGVISYYADMKIYDFYGLVDSQIAHKQINGIGFGFPGHEKKDIVYLLSKRPTYFMFTRELSKEPLNYPSYNEIADKMIRENYKLTSIWMVDRENNEEGYFSFLELK